jgi:hypothetical protein
LAAIAAPRATQHHPARRGAAIKEGRVDQGHMHVVLRSNRVHSPLIDGKSGGQAPAGAR